MKTDRDRIWARRHTGRYKNAPVIWELHHKIEANGIHMVIAYIQVYPNGSTSYWFLPNEKAVECKNYGNMASDVSAAIQDTMSIVERKLAE